MSQNNIIIKVGNKSASRFRDVNVFRAITIKEMALLQREHNVNIIVVESISQSEYDSAKDFIVKYLEDENNHIFFYVPDNNDNTTGIADELNLDIYMDIKDLYNVIKTKCGINVDTDLDTHKGEYSIIDGDGFNSEFDSDFGFEFEGQFEVYDNAKNKINIEEMKVVSIMNKSEAGIFKDEDDEVEDTTSDEYSDISIKLTGSYGSLILFIIYALFAYLIPDEKLIDRETKGLRNFMILVVCIQLFAPLHTLAMRFNYYYLLFIPLLISKVLDGPECLSHPC